MTGANSRTVSLRDLPELVTVKQVAECAQVSTQTVYRLVEKKQLKGVKVRGAVRINRDDACRYFGL